jgi:hypothetical protein
MEGWAGPSYRALMHQLGRPTASKPDVAAASAEIRVLQKKGSEFLMQSHQLPDILLDFERGMDHGPIVSSSEEREKGEQILKSLRTQCAQAAQGAATVATAA